MPEKTINLYAKALAMLSRRDHSQQEIINKLRKFTSDIAQINATINTLQEQGYLNDQRYSANFIEWNSAKSGPLKLRYQLKNKGIASDLIEAMLADSATDELQVAYALWQRKFAGKIATSPKEKARQIRFLLSRGFSYDIITQVFKLAHKA